MALDHTGTSVVISDNAADSLRHLGKGGKVATLAGSGKPGLNDGQGSAAHFDAPTIMRWGADGRLYVEDEQNKSLRIVDAKGKVSTWRPYMGGKSAIPSGGDFDVDADGRVVALYAGSAIKLLTPDGKSTQINQTQFPGNVDGPIATAQFDGVTAVAFAPSGDILVGGPTGVRLVAGGQVSTLKPPLIDGPPRASARRLSQQRGRPISARSDPSSMRYPGSSGSPVMVRSSRSAASRS